MIPELGHQRRKLYLIRAFGAASTLDGYREAALRLIWRLIAALPRRITVPNALILKTVMQT